MTEIFRINTVCSKSLDIERARVVTLINSVLPEHRLYEVGSTAVEGVIGKQDLDFLVRVPKNDFFTTQAKLDKHFTRNKNQLSNDVFQGYIVDSSMDVAIQLTIEDGPFDDFVTFLTKLRASDKLRKKYNQLKMEFDGLPMSEYRDAKHEFIERVLGAGK